MPSLRKALATLLALAAPSQAARGLDAAASAGGANPIRKVVTMLQAMQEKVTEEGEREQELYEKFMCYCRNSGGALKAGVAEAEAKIGQLGTGIKEAESHKIRLDEELKQAQSDRAAAKEAMEEATAIREKEADSFAKEKAELDADISAITKAVAALERGMAGGFLQTGAASVLRALVAKPHDSLMDDDRQTLLAFLDGSSSYAPQSGMVTGILKQLNEETKQTLKEATEEEELAKKTFGELMAAKKKEVSATSEAIETKMTRSGELAVEIVQMKNELSDTEESLMADKEFLANMEKDCQTKTAEWEEIKKTRADELVALSETIKILNDDDALELFKKTLPSEGGAFVQVRAAATASRKRALAMVRKALAFDAKAGRPVRTDLDFLGLALQGRKVGLEKVLKMIDDMVATLKQEQKDDDNKKEYCGKQLDEADDSRKELERSIADKETAIAQAEEAVTTLTEEIAALKAGIKALDKSVAEATEQRKEEHEEFTTLMASDTAAKELLGYARNRLNKFYNPKLHQPENTPPPAEAEPTESEPVLAQVAAHFHKFSSGTTPPPPPEAPGAYEKKGQESNGVIAMINLLITDLEKEMTEAETEERDAQAAYEGSMKDAAEKRAADSKLSTEKGAEKASLLEGLSTHKEEKSAQSKELAATLKYLTSLHAECDWLLKYFDIRVEARSGEIDSLNKAKAILSGADFGL